MIKSTSDYIKLRKSLDEGNESRYWEYLVYL